MKGIYVHACVCMYMLFLVNWDLGIFYGLSSVMISLKCVFPILASTIFNLKKPMANRCN